MVGSRSTARDDVEYTHIGCGAIGLHYLHGHRPGGLAERGFGALALELPPAGTAHSSGWRTSKSDGAARSQVSVVCAIHAGGHC